MPQAHEPAPVPCSELRGKARGTRKLIVPGDQSQVNLKRLPLFWRSALKRVSKGNCPCVRIARIHGSSNRRTATVRSVDQACHWPSIRVCHSEMS